MAAEELEKINVITKLSNRALQEYEGMQRKHETAAMECKKLEEERDEAMKKLNEFQQVSQMVIEEVNDIQQSLDIERTCRLSAEALASKLNRQNRSLKRKSMMLLPHLGPEVIAEVGLDEDDEEEEEEESEERHAASNVCLSPLCQPTSSELQTVRDLEALREQLGGTREELLKEKLDNTALIAETVRQKKLLAKYNRVSQFAVEEFEVLQDTLKLERDLRTEAEGFARAMVVEQTKLKRESQILMESSSPSQALQEALGQVSRLTQDLETQRLEHQNQMKQMEDRLRSCEAQRELMALRRKLELMEEEKREHSDNCSKAKLEVKDLRFTVEELQQKLQAVTNPPPAPAPAPPPPPPPPPPAPAVASNPLSSLLSLIRRRRDVSTDIPLVVQDSAQTPDVRQQAVDEMMHRIKKGVQLRPVGQSPSRTRRQMERLPSNSAIQELKGIMDKFGRTPPPQPKATPPPSPTRDEQLQRILLRRRDALEPQRHADAGLMPCQAYVLDSLLSLIRRRRDVSTDIPLVVQDSAQTPDVRQQAVDEMMHRIKKGVQLRPVGQSPSRTRRQMERLPSNSAIQELKGIMDKFGRTPPPQPKATPPPSPTRDEQLQRILLRRRDALEPQRHAGPPPPLPPAV